MSTEFNEGVPGETMPTANPVAEPTENVVPSTPESVPATDAPAEGDSVQPTTPSDAPVEPVSAEPTDAPAEPVQE